MQTGQDVKILFNDYLALFKQLKNQQKLSHKEHNYLFVLAHVFYAYVQGYKHIVTENLAKLPNNPKQALGVLLAEPQMKRNLGDITHIPQLTDFLVIVRDFMTSANIYSVHS